MLSHATFSENEIYWLYPAVIMPSFLLSGCFDDVEIKIRRKSHGKNRYFDNVFGYPIINKLRKKRKFLMVGNFKEILSQWNLFEHK